MATTPDPQPQIIAAQQPKSVSPPMEEHPTKRHRPHLHHKDPRAPQQPVGTAAKDAELLASNNPFMPMFLHFREDLDTHHDRRERVIKASRDVTALSKKMIFTLQRYVPTPRFPPAY